MDIIAREYLTILRTKILPYTDKGDPVSAKTPVVEPNLTNVKSHLFKLLHALLPRFPEIRARLATSRPVHPRNENGVDPLRDFEVVVREVEKVVTDELDRNPEGVVAATATIHGHVNRDTGLVKIGEWNCVPGGWVGPKRRRGRVVSTIEQETRDGEVVVVEEEEEIFGWDIPFYRCQPNFRPLPEEAVKRGAMSASVLEKDRPGGGDSDAADTENEKQKERERQRQRKEELQKERQIGDDDDNDDNDDDGDRDRDRDGVKRVKVTE